MTPERKQLVCGKIVEEFYLAGKLVTYVDYVKSADNFDLTIEKIQASAREVEQCKANDSQ